MKDEHHVSGIQGGTCDCHYCDLYGRVDLYEEGKIR